MAPIDYDEVSSFNIPCYAWPFGIRVDENNNVDFFYGDYGWNSQLGYSVQSNINNVEKNIYFKTYFNGTDNVEFYARDWDDSTMKLYAVGPNGETFLSTLEKRTQSLPFEAPELTYDAETKVLRYHFSDGIVGVSDIDVCYRRNNNSIREGIIFQDGEISGEPGDEIVIFISQNDDPWGILADYASFKFPE